LRSPPRRTDTQPSSISKTRKAERIPTAFAYSGKNRTRARGAAPADADSPDTLLIRICAAPPNEKIAYMHLTRRLSQALRPVHLRRRQLARRHNRDCLWRLRIELPNPRVRVTDIDTNAVAEVTAGYRGEFAVKGLPPGRYTVSVTSFDGFPESRVELRDGETARVDLRIRELSISPDFAKRRRSLCPNSAAPVRQASPPSK
jgi:hypothetical protein